MAHSVELILDPEGEAAMTEHWRRLAAAGLPSQSNVRSDTNRPHVTLIAAQRISSDVDDALRDLAPMLPLACAIGSSVVFSGARLTLARLVVPSAGLLDFQERVYRRCLPHLSGQPFAHCAPGHWTPHVTLGRRFTADQIGAAFALADDAAPSEVATRFVGLRRWDGDSRVDHLLIGGAD